MTQKAKHEDPIPNLVAPVVLFGVDEHGKPKAARFPEKHAELATKAAGQLKLQILAITNPDIAELAGRLPAGRVHANGRGFVPYIRRDLYTKLLAAAGTSAQGDQPPVQAAAVGGSAGDASSPKGGAPGKPRNWDEIGPGHVVIAQEDYPTDGWYEAIVAERDADMLTLRWREYPRQRRISRHRFSVGLLYPNGDDPPAPAPTQTGKPRRSGPQPPAPAGTAYPKSWDDIAVGCVVLAKDDGPWVSWWEAIPTDQTGDTFSLRWRDLPDMSKVARPDIARHRLSLGLLYPNKQ
jgi:hypothetical protein